MAMNRIQFQPGMSLSEFFERYGSEAHCEAALEQARWPQGFCCPRCSGGAHWVLKARGRKTLRCNACHHQTSLIAGTLFEGTKLALPVWFLAIYLISQAKTGLSALALKRDLGVKLTRPPQPGARYQRLDRLPSAIAEVAGVMFPTVLPGVFFGMRATYEKTA
jgi:hypothetical protein